MPEPTQPSVTDSEFARLVRSRRTINDFETRQPPREAVLRAIELARWAPNHKLTEPWRFHVLGPQTLSAVLDLNTRLLEASKGQAVAQARREKWGKVPGWIVVTCRRSPGDEFREREDFAAVACAIQNLCLALWSEGIGTKWSTNELIRDPAFLPLLGADAQQEFPVGLLWYGYALNTPASRRKDVVEICVEHP